MSALGMAGAAVMLGREPGREVGVTRREEKPVAWPGLGCLW